MNRILLLSIVVIIGGLIASISLFNDQLANAGSTKKIQFTKTITSSQDPGVGHGNEQMAIILPPNKGSIYHGSITYSSSMPVQVVILHQIDKTDSAGQPTWTVDGNTLYAVTTIDQNSSGGSLDFTGSAIGLHSVNSSQFTVTASVDGWIRTTTPDVIPVSTIMPTANNTLKMAESTTPIKIPLHEGLVNGKTMYYVITDSSNILVANNISEKQNWQVQLSPTLAHVPIMSFGNIFIFTNGITGNGTRGYQDDVLSSIPSDNQYSPLNKVIEVSWNVGRGPFILNSTKAILDANTTGKVKLTTTDTILNTPAISWDGGNLGIRSNKILSDQVAYVGGQLLDVNTNNMTATFVGHRGWGPDGKTIYYIITSGTPQGPAQTMKIPNVSVLSFLDSYARDVYHFANGIQGAGPFGYQEGISSTQLGDSDYSPLCKISIITWKDPKTAEVLETKNDIDFEKANGAIDIQEAITSGKNYMLDCPIVKSP
ncbi:conserved exported hypothetical protein [Nitrosotalea sinensis]|uniref:DUF7482 domain-containing protein n=1 Tax=Nitrosotalea sinensis TaxID=1499975 RepID=A0A2H1EF02_9ARCH|nr:hypothetical protein [Candidatus Nitrosotalea sinensis]SHO43620.1 conserved exported hypothetical protein [Candidatus Nitrosotalea sinensis]